MAAEPLPICGLPTTLMLLLRKEEELEVIVKSLDMTCTMYEMVISVERTKIMVISTHAWNNNKVQEHWNNCLR